MPLQKIISGGQTGVDRAALDAALDVHFCCGGWCPEGRLAADGILPAHYPLEELCGAGYRKRTIKNLQESDGTLLIYFVAPEGGSNLTLTECQRRQKPLQLINAAEIDVEQALKISVQFIQENKIRTLNVAGPSAAREPLAYDYAYALISQLIHEVMLNLNKIR